MANFDLFYERWRQVGFYGNVSGRTDDFLPGRSEHDVRRFRIEPEIEFMPGIICELGAVALRSEAAAHEDKSLGQFGEFGIDRDGEGEVSHGRALVDRDLVRIFVD